MITYSYDYAGLYIGPGAADESPLEPGVYLMPARCTVLAPPEDFAQDKWPRWNGAAWDLVNKPTASTVPSPVEKLQAFLEANPDVLELLE